MTPEQRITEIRNNEATAKADLVAAESAVQEIETKITDLKNEVAAGTMSSAQFRTKHAKLQSELEAADVFRAVKATVVAKSSDGIEEALEEVARADQAETAKVYDKQLAAYVGFIKKAAKLQSELFDTCRAIHLRTGSIAFRGNEWGRDLITDLTTALAEEMPGARARWPGRSIDDWASKYETLPTDLEDLAAQKARRNPNMETGNA